MTVKGYWSDCYVLATSEFSKKITDYLDDKNYKIAEFSRELKLDDSVVHSWINLENYPSIECLIKVADYMKCSTDYLFNLSNEKSYYKSTSNETFKDRLIFLQLERNMSSYQISQKLELASSTPYSWITKDRKPIVETLINLTILLRTSIDFILVRTDER